MHPQFPPRMAISRQVRISSLIALALCLTGTLFVIRHKRTVVKVYLPNLRFFNATRTFSRNYYSDLYDLGFFDEDRFLDIREPLPNVTFITALSYNHMGEGMAMVYWFSLYFKGQKIIMYDLGLRAGQRKWFEDNACNVELREINFTSLKIGSSLLTYRWKPIIIATALKEFPVVFYLDSSTDMKTNVSVNEFLSNITMRVDEPNIYAICITDHSPYAAIHPKMYDYFPPQMDIKRPMMLEAGKAVYIRTKSTYDLGLKWYVLCALEEECMAPPGANLTCTWGDRHLDYANCHRYDQAALNLIMGVYPNFNQSALGMQYFWTHYNHVVPRTLKPEC